MAPLAEAPPAAAHGAGGASSSPPAIVGLDLKEALLDIGAPTLAAVLCFALAILCFCVRRWRRRRRIALLWQQHIQDTSGALGDSFLDVPAAGTVNG